MTVFRARLRTAARLTPADWRLLGEVAAALVAARLASGLPFRTLAHRLGGLRTPGTPPPPTPPLSPDDEAAVFAIRWAVGTVAPWLPFKARCFQQAIAARRMLARRGIASVLHLGVGDPTGTGLEAHAWLDAGGLKVTGYPVDPALAEAGRFV